MYRLFPTGSAGRTLLALGSVSGFPKSETALRRLPSHPDSVTSRRFGPARRGPRGASADGYFLSGLAMVSRIVVSAMMFFIL